jgi:osmoprotectant transport system ATP-binding protein
MKMINRIIEPTSGSISIDGRDVLSLDPNELRRHIGYVIQQIGLFPHQTISQNIETVPRMLGWDKQKARARSEELLGMVGLDPERYRDSYPKALSGGQAQRVGVARALGADPDIMLMDEPFGAIDPITRERLQNEFLRLQGELRKTIVFVTHDIDEAIKMGDKIAILGDRSTIRQIDTPERILAYPVDDFVDDFIGTGSTIKGLNFLKVSSLALTDYPTLEPSGSAESGRAALQDTGREWLVQLDENRTPVRWVRADGLDSAADERGEPVGELLHSQDTLFHALELMVQSASGETCVVDESGAFVGVVRMVDLAKAIRRAQYEARLHYEELEARA